MRRQYDIDVARQVFKDAGCELLEDTYSDNKTPMRYRCRCGNTSHARLSDFVRGTRCGCGREKEASRRRHSLNFVRRYFLEHGCELLDDEYVHNHSLLRFRCECGNTGQVAFADFQNGVRCGCRRQLGLHRKWDETRVVSDLQTYITKHGGFPTSKELRRSDCPGLDAAIESLGGYNHFRRILHHELNSKPAGYWQDWNSVEDALRQDFGDMIGRGVCPNSRMIQEVGIPTSIVTTFGGLPDIAQRLNCRLASCWRTRDGHVVFSFYEFIFDEYLFSVGVPHEPNARILSGRKYSCDQRIDKLCVEIFGYGPTGDSSRARAYNRNRKTKEAIYERLGLRLVSIEQAVFLKPYPKIEDSLDVLFSSLGFDVTRKRPFDIFGLAQQAGFVLTEEEALRQLKEVIAEFGDFPTVKMLTQIGRGDLLLQIQKTGGQNHYRRLLGLSPPVKPNNYWTLDRTLQMLKARSDELGRLPRQKEM